MLKPPFAYTSKLPSNIKLYIGKFTGPTVDKKIIRASICYENQLRRCYTKTNPRYKDNGAKGIQVLYNKRDFVSWYLHHIELYNGKNPSVGRIDHSKSYSFDNIRIESIEENSLERISRVGTTRPKRHINIIEYNTGKIVKTVFGYVEAAKITGANKSHISLYCSGILGKTKSGYTFRYADDGNSEVFKSFKYKDRSKLKNPIVILDANSGENIFIAYSLNEISYLTGIQKSHVRKYCQGIIKKSKNGYSLKEWNGDESKQYTV